MARNESKRSMGKPARDAVKSLADTLKLAGVNLSIERQPGEFTVLDASNETGSGYEQMRTQLRHATKAGKLVARKGRENGKACLFFRAV